MNKKEKEKNEKKGLTGLDKSGKLIKSRQGKAE